MSESKINIMNNKKEKKTVIKRIALILIFIILVVIGSYYLYQKKQVEKHELWVKNKQEEFDKLISEVYEVISGKKIVDDENILRWYNISHYADYETATNVEVTLKVTDIEEIEADQEYKISVIYSQILENNKGKVIAGSADVDSYWTVKKEKNGEWRIIDVHELV